MAYFDDLKKANAYVKMMESYAPSFLIETFSSYVPSGSAILELGIGAGVDFAELEKRYIAYGSDLSQSFLDLYRSKSPSSKLLKLDALKLYSLSLDDPGLDYPQRFAAIYSNKVLHNLSPDELGRSLKQQRDILTPVGQVLHSFWLGEGSEEYDGLIFYYYGKAELKRLFSGHFRIIEMEEYTEEEKGDSIYVLAQVKEG